MIKKNLLKSSLDIYDIVNALREETAVSTPIGDKRYTLTTGEAAVIVLAAQYSYIEAAIKKLADADKEKDH